MEVFDCLHVIMANTKELQVSIIGGGLVGTLCATILGNQGIQVKVYEYRDDIRNTEAIQGRSMNLTLSERGRSALRLAGIEDGIINQLITPIKGRILHTQDGRRIPFPVDRTGRCLFSVVRKDLHEVLVALAEKNPNLEIFFKHKFLTGNFESGKYQIMSSDGTVKEETTNLLIGCDGAYSAVRKLMLRMPRFDFSQSYFEHGFLELFIPPTAAGEFAMEDDYLHYWPRKHVMLAALPNRNCTFTASLFMPFEMFEQMNTPEKLLQLFSENFPDAIPLIGKERLIADFFKSSPSAMVSIKCNPYHMEDKLMIMGDAAHAMLPFNGQGMNTGFEDCEILSELLGTHNYDLSKVLPAFTECRQKDAEIICDLARLTYGAMRLHHSKKFLLRSKLDELLNAIFPKSWIVMNSTVNFSKLRYSQCLARAQMQDKIVSSLMWTFAVIGVSCFITILTRF